MLIRTVFYGLHGFVNTPEINRTIPDTVSYLTDNCGNSQVVDIISRNDLEPDCIVVVEILDALKWTSLILITMQLVRRLLTASLQRMPPWILLLDNKPSSCAR